MKIKQHRIADQQACISNHGSLNFTLYIYHTFLMKSPQLMCMDYIMVFSCSTDLE